MTASHRILIVDDHPVVRRGIAEFLEQEQGLAVCAEATTAEEAFSLLEDTRPDLVVLDLGLENQSGLDVLKQIHASYPSQAVLVLSMYDERIYAERVLQAGARGYVMKKEPSDTVVKAVRKVLRGEVYVSPDVSSRILQGMARGGETVSPIDTLSDRELEVLELLGSGYQTRHIAERLSLSPKTVEGYKGRLKAKLDLSGAAELGRFAAEWVHSRLP